MLSEMNRPERVLAAVRLFFAVRRTNWGEIQNSCALANDCGGEWGCWFRDDVAQLTVGSIYRF